ncbi:RNA polymerase sigma-70 factor, ECF subfamily [Geosporobacter subterraneus DSM 17957]|uniref:RNA polymerase sigma-70 factor, ECF subfamily n=1 Tax=Geosporobacter subterraneus DSM 17957 TaxID=1121919 RepID=A0A1M6KMA1_9FIRM|nr:RNA polymerase sigma factor [Geosporobacter subterraneus]SHJ59964.1 RNA polymerase sigma-70 factor, ECF subfamily [Geosporobacter subterraneus DSM 17957]
MGIFSGLKDRKSEALSLHRVLFETYRNKVYKTAYFIVKNEDDAKDIVQDTFVIAFSKLEQLRDTEKFEAWLCTIACNLAKDRYNKNKREICMADEDQILAWGYDNHKFGFELPEDILEKKEVQAYIREQIKGLKHHYSEVLYLYYYCDLSYEEISKALNLNIGTVKTRLFRAKNILKDSLQGMQLEKEGSHE